jgi:hypothetical protein
MPSENHDKIERYNPLTITLNNIQYQVHKKYVYDSNGHDVGIKLMIIPPPAASLVLINDIISHLENRIMGIIGQPIGTFIYRNPAITDISIIVIYDHNF